MTTETLHGRLAFKGHVAIDPQTCAAIEQHIPPEHTVLVNAKSSAVYWLIYCHGPNGGRVTSGPVRVSRGVPLRGACLLALERWRERGVLA